MECGIRHQSQKYILGNPVSPPTHDLTWRTDRKHHFDSAPPKSVYSNGPVRDVIEGAKNAIRGLVTGDANPTGGDK